MTSGPEAGADPNTQAELVFGVVGPVGVDIDAVTRSLARSLSRFAYRSESIRLTSLLDELAWEQELPSGPADRRVSAYMQAGNALRTAWRRDDAFALLAIHAIQVAREVASGQKTLPAGRFAYLLRSLKRPEEARLLRQVYGDRFVLLSLYAPASVRRGRLAKEIQESRQPPETEPEHSADDLLARDQREKDTHGQNVRGLFHDGDFFLDVTQDLDTQIDRTVELLFGHPHRTPTRDEQGMYFAEAASLRSAELGRQVGAALCTTDGSLVSAGANDVPTAGGGLYWEGDAGDAREFTQGRDTSDERKTVIGERLAEQLADAGVLAPDALPDAVTAAIAETPVDDLIEFVRAVHAEMAVITDAARRGIAMADTTLYVTTFPCHHCARHIVAAGVQRVVYVAPYPKSLAAALHGDALIVDPEDQGSSDSKVPFVPFIGVGPRRYADVFRMPPRKHPDGRLVEFEPQVALPRIRAIEPDDLVPESTSLSYVRRELRALSLLAAVMQEREPRFEGFDPSTDSSQHPERP